MAEPPCQCGEIGKTTEVKCFACEDCWTRPFTAHERLCDCPQHFQFIAVCGPPHPELCAGCLKKGYYVQASSSYFVPTFTLAKRAPGEADDGLF